MTTIVSLQPGVRFEASQVVSANQLVPNVAPDWPGFVGMPPVFATAMMIGFIEQTCIQALAPYLDAGQATVGTHVDVSHVAATPQGMRVSAQVELVAIEGRTLLFKVRCEDEGGLIGECLHRRAIIDSARFLQKLATKTPLPG
ncbi:thioesterase [Stenotrophomonas sp. SAU14A_NAIMI4_5]|uniref:thioesterase family protein n=1 Tax=Stenotrophomonas sp. SAU14A_NAIMI4_5 TaxID=2072413 RepID=UPI000D53CB4A|nr:thioesterase family protein [Stenotrophomonas sp. SAU14A_NAIMI4_5]AWH49101.1 thioesterase [Stenotrophomonas sp. SAU14A_NAIMI4_5]